MPISHQKRVQTIALCRSMAQQLLDSDEAMRRGKFGAVPYGTFDTIMSAFEATGCVHKHREGFGSTVFTWVLERTELAESVFQRIADSDEDAVRVLWPPVEEEAVDAPLEEIEAPIEPEAPVEEPVSQEQLVELIATVLQGFKTSIESIDSKIGAYGGAVIELASVVGKLNAEKLPPPPVSSVDDSVADLVLTAVAENTEAVKQLTDKTSELNFLFSKFVSGASSLQAERAAVREDVVSLTKTVGMLREDLKKQRADYVIDEHGKYDILVALAEKQNGLWHSMDSCANALHRHNESLLVTGSNQEVLIKAVGKLSDNARDAFQSVLMALSKVSKGGIFDLVVADTPAAPTPKPVEEVNGKKKLPSLSKIVEKKDEEKTRDYQEHLIEKIMALPDSVSRSVVMDPVTNTPVYKPQYTLVSPPKEEAK